MMNPVMEATNYLHLIDWDRSEFDLRKAYVCSLFSELTYWKIPEFEYRVSRRANVIPCSTYQSMVRERHFVDIDQTIREADVGPSFTIIRRYAVVVGVRTPKMIIVAIRGTAPLYDWLANLRATKFSHSLPTGTALFHTGFYKAAMACLGPVACELNKYTSNGADPLPVYFTGHSLGAAISAILMNMLLPHFFEKRTFWKPDANRRGIRGCYTFGMPRYGDLHAVANCLEPYHLYNDADIVPTVPPSWMGFHNCFNEYRLDGEGIENVQGRDTLNFLQWIASLMVGVGLASNKMELYRERIKNNI
jgi:predicted lipase